MILCRCSVCSWELKLKGVFKAHHEMRTHMKNEHPSEFTAMLTQEMEIREQHSALMKQYGLAVRPLNMNL